MNAIYARIVLPVKQIDITSEQQRFIASEIKAGRFRDASEVLQAALVLLQKERKKKESLKEMIQAGAEQADGGQGILLTSPEAVRSHTKMLRQKVEKLLRNK